MSPAPDAREQLQEIFGEALAAVDAGAAVRRALVGSPERLVVAGHALRPAAQIHLLAVGKAAAGMAAAFDERAGAAVVAGLVVTKDGHGAAPDRFVQIEAGHPVPDARSVQAAQAVLEFVARPEPADVLCVLLSGGASSLLSAPLPGLTLEDLAEATRALLEGGADIEALNAVRKHVCSAAGGRLARACRAGSVVVLAISDVPGDRLDVIGSGPFEGDTSTYAEALAALDASGRSMPVALRAHLEAGMRGESEETPKPGDPQLARVRSSVLLSNRTALETAREAALRRGLAVRVVSQPLRGEAREEAVRLVDLARRAVPGAPLCLIAGGETTVTVAGRGRGGRNQELALAAALALEDAPGISLLAAGTDGTDGPTDAAGAFADAGTVDRGREVGADAAEALADNDAYGFFSAEGGLFRTGPTGTNVMDLALLRVEPAPATRG